MKTQKIILGSLYAFLILLFILLCLLRCCDREEPVQPEPDPPVEDLPEYTEDEINDRAEAVGHDGRLKITLLWDFPGDVDLHVKEPNNFEIYYANARDRRTGGYLDVDNIPGGNNSAENVYWETPLPGHYQVSVVYYSYQGGHRSGGPCTVVVKREVDGVPQTEQFVVSVSRASRSTRIPVTEFNIY